MKIWTLAGLALAASQLASGCGPAESSVAGPEGAGPAAAVELAPRATVEDGAIPSGDVAAALTKEDRAAKSDARLIATMMEVYFTEVMAYPTALVERRSAEETRIDFPHGNSIFDSVKLSLGTSASVRSDGQSFCITMINPAATRSWVYESDSGGFQAAPDAICDAEDGPAILGS
jgi:hypothetical protein